jgi:SAM-dependent methyltransferase
MSYNRNLELLLTAEYPAKNWLAANASDTLIQATDKLVAAEKRERVIRNEGSSIDYGYSFPGLQESRDNCLKAIRHYHATNGMRPMIADIGAGFGNMTWKMLAAGGQVDAFEIQKPTAVELKNRIQRMPAHHWEGAKIKDILNVFSDNVLNVLSAQDFSEKYDFVWMGNIIHFLTPEDFKKLNAILLQVLKPNGKLIIETNTLTSFNSISNYSIIAATYSRAKQKGIEFPGFMGASAITIIDASINEVLACSFVSVLDSEEMRLNAIPYQTQAYGKEYLLASEETQKNEALFQSQTKIPSGHIAVPNRFNMVMHLLDEDIALKAYTSAGFSYVDSYYYNSDDGHRIPAGKTGTMCGLSVTVEKPKTDLTSQSFFNQSPGRQLLLETFELCRNHKDQAGFVKAVKEADYSLALRRACAIGQPQLTTLIFKYTPSISVDINKASQSNGWTPLDWIENAKDVAPAVKDAMIADLLCRGALNGPKQTTTKAI